MNSSIDSFLQAFAGDCGTVLGKKLSHFPWLAALSDPPFSL
jgi:hypothetical protein